MKNFQILLAFFRIFFSESISNRLRRLELSSRAFFLRICFRYGIEKLFCLHPFVSFIYFCYYAFVSRIF